MSINSLAYSRVVTARIHVKPDGFSTAFNLGTLETAIHDPEVERIPILGSGKGFVYERAQQPVQITHKYSATATEKTPYLIELCLLAETGTDEVQPAGTGLTGTFLVTQFVPMKLGAQSVSSVVVKNAAGTITYDRDVDYDLDEGNGFIEWIAGGSIVIGSNVHVTWNQATVTQTLYIPNTKRTTTGDVEIMFNDSHGNSAVETHTFNGQYYISGNATQGSKEQQKWTIDFRSARRHEVRVRKIT